MSMYHNSFKPHHGRHPHHNPYSNNFHPYEEFNPFPQFGSAVFPPFPPPMFPNMFPHHEFAAAAAAGANQPRSAVDWHETHDAHVMTAKLPGYRKEEVKLELEEEERHVLHLSCEKKSDHKEEKSSSEGNYYHSERSNGGRFVQRVKLPENSNPENIKAELEHGVLTVTIPKKKKDSKKRSSRIILIT